MQPNHDHTKKAAPSNSPPKPRPPVDTSNPDRLIDSSDLATFTGISPTYVRQMRVHGGGPRFIKLTEKTVRYRVRDVLAWIDSRPAAASTSELEAA